MQDCTVVYADLVGSTSSSLSNIDTVLKLVQQEPHALYFNTWGDAFIAVFDSAVAAVTFALSLRDEIRMFDWRTNGHAKPPQLRTAIAVGPVGWRPAALRDLSVPEGGVLVEAARIEPTTSPSEVRVTEAVRKLAGDEYFFYEDIGEVALPKQAGHVRLSSAHRSEERVAIKGLL